MATAFTSCNSGFLSASYCTILYSEPGCTQCATVSTRLGAIRLPVQKLPREPMMVTTERPMASGAGAAPPTMANAGIGDSSAATMAGRILIGYSHSLRGARRQAAGPGWRQSIPRVSRSCGELHDLRDWMIEAVIWDF